MTNTGNRVLSDGYEDPIVVIGANRGVAYANTAAFALFGSHDGKPCHLYMYGHAVICPFCVRKEWATRGKREVVRRCETVHTVSGEHIEKYVIFSPGALTGAPDAHVEILAPLPQSRAGTRAIMEFAKALESVTSVERVFAEVVRFFGSEDSVLKSRVRFYAYGKEAGTDTLTCTLHDDLKDDPPYRADLKGRVLKRGMDSHSFKCIDERRWFIMTPSGSDVNAFCTLFAAALRPGHTNTYDAAPVGFQPALSLYHYDPEKDRPAPVFAIPTLHVWLDIPIIWGNKTYGKLCITLSDNSLLFYSEKLEELGLVERVVSRHLGAIRTVEMERLQIIQNVFHEVAQPAFAGLGSMEMLRRRDRANDRTAKSDPLDFYLKKNVECSMRMVAFLNDRALVAADPTSWADQPCDLLSDVAAPVVNLMRFRIYENQLRDSSAKLSPRELDDVPEQQPGGERWQSAKSVFGATTYEIEYDGTLADVFLYVDRYRLQQTIYNLLWNALKYRGAGSDYRVRIGRRDQLPSDEANSLRDYYVIDVTDQGTVGIDEDEQEIIFEFGVQGKKARQVAGLRGTGRGLYVCRTIMRGIGGEIFVQNLKNPTVFRLLFPRECDDAAWVKDVVKLTERTGVVMKDYQERRRKSDAQ